MPFDPDDLLEEFPELRAKWIPEDHPVIQIIRTGQYIPPERMHNLTREIALAKDCIKDVWCPERCKDNLLRFVEEATALLREGA